MKDKNEEKKKNKIKDRFKDKDGIFKSLFAAYFVILLHVFLLAGTGLTVILFRGVYNYLPWIMGGLALLLLALFWLFYTRMKKSSRDLKDVLSFPEFRGRAVEVKLLGGLATFSIGEGRENNTPLIGHDDFYDKGGQLKLAAPPEGIEHRLAELARLYGEGLVTKEEFDVAKKRILFE
ncbi:MAG: SHOCT domain-containing protein [Desulfobacterium sp.]|jgi:hypothetical protein|nr:SHOCT domain-containing protein [Desulfobacterium sp.]